MAAITAISALVLAEDPATSGAVVRHLFSAGFLVHEARSEDDAVRHASEATPDVVILDLLFEEGPGTAVCRRLRELPATEDIPILALTGSHDVATKVRLLELGCDGFVGLGPKRALSGMMRELAPGSAATSLATPAAVEQFQPSPAEQG